MKKNILYGEGLVRLDSFSLSNFYILTLKVNVNLSFAKIKNGALANFRNFILKNN